jgi:diguanylate cyclase (GGDEF)-like protein
LLNFVLAFTTASVSSGSVVALALICLLQYLAHVHRLNRVRREIADVRTEHDELRRELHGVSNELTEARRERTISRFEAQVLREFVLEQDCDKAVRVFVRRFVPDPENGFAAFFSRREDGRMTASHSHGMQVRFADNLDLESDLLSRLPPGGMLTLSREETRRSRMWQSLSPPDRSKIKELHLFGIGLPGELLGVLMATALPPADFEASQRAELARRLLSGIAVSLRDKRQLANREDQIRSSGDRLALRSVADRDYESPAQMLEEFLRHAAVKLGAERASLHVHTNVVAAPFKGFIRCGETLQAGLKEQWERHEDELAHVSLALRAPRQYSPAELGQRGITTLLGSALVVPVLQQNRLLGLVCFSRRTRSAYSEADLALAAWSGDLLADLIPRVANQAVVERQARLDGLTQLANRGEFDREIQQQFQTARRQQSPLSLLMFDLDRFKSINDTHGHRAGDTVLRAAAGTLRDSQKAIRSADRAAGVLPFIARYGGEEMVLLVQLDKVAARRIGESLRVRLEAQAIEFEGRSIRVTTSIGLATYPDHAESPAELIAAADAALYRAKSLGRNRLEIADHQVVATCPGV